MLDHINLQAKKDTHYIFSKLALEDLSAVWRSQGGQRRCTFKQQRMFHSVSSQGIRRLSVQAIYLSKSTSQFAKKQPSDLNQHSHIPGAGAVIALGGLFGDLGGIQGFSVN